MQPYGQLVSIASGLWVRDGDWYDTAFKRRMTVMSLGDGSLVVHNPFVLSDGDLTQLRSLGQIAAIVMPNSMHGDDMGWMATQVPEARILVPAAVRAKLQKKHRVDGTLEADWPQAWAADVACKRVGGMRMLHEFVFYHKTSRTLVLTDLAFNMKPEDFNRSFERKLMRWNHVGVGFGPSLLCDKFFTRNHDERRKSVEVMLNWDFDRVVVNHGSIIASGGKELMRAAFAA